MFAVMPGGTTNWLGLEKGKEACVFCEVNKIRQQK